MKEPRMLLHTGFFFYIRWYQERIKLAGYDEIMSSVLYIESRILKSSL